MNKFKPGDKVIRKSTNENDRLYAERHGLKEGGVYTVTTQVGGSVSLKEVGDRLIFNDYNFQPAPTPPMPEMYIAVEHNEDSFNESGEVCNSLQEAWDVVARSFYAPDTKIYRLGTDEVYTVEAISKTRFTKVS